MRGTDSKREAMRGQAWSCLCSMAMAIACLTQACALAHVDTRHGQQGESGPLQSAAGQRGSFQLSTPSAVYRVVDRRIEVRAVHGGAVLSEIEQPEPVRALHAAGPALFVAGQARGVSVFDLRDLRRPAEHGSLAQEQLVGSFVQTENQLQLRSPSGLTSSWYDITEPLRPRFLRRLQQTGPDDDDEGDTAARLQPARPGLSCTLRLRDGQQLSGTALPDTPEGHRVLRTANHLTWVISPGELISATLSMPAAAAGRDLTPGDNMRCGGALDYDVDGALFTISRGSSRGRVTLGWLRLPWTTQPPVLLRGRAAFVRLAEGGLAVIDITLSRYPYVAWRLQREQAIRSARLEQASLLLTTDTGELSYDLHDPLYPKGPGVSPAQPLRLYEGDGLQPLNSDESWSEPARRWPASGRRVYAKGGAVLVGYVLQIDSFRGQLYLELGTQRVRLPVSDILHIEPVELATPPALAGPRAPHLDLPPPLPPPFIPDPAKRVRRNQALEIGLGLVLATPGITLITIGLSVAVLQLVCADSGCGFGP